MELRIYFEILWRRKWIIILVTLLTMGGVILAMRYAEPRYVSSTTLRIATAGSGFARGYSDIPYSDRLLRTYARMVDSSSTREEIVSRFNLEEVPDITVEPIPNTELIVINSEAATADIAQKVAVAAADILIYESRQLYVGGGQTALDILSRQIDQVEVELTDLRSEYDATLAEPTPDQARLDAIKESIALKESTYTTLLDQYQQTQLNEALVANTVSVVEPAYLPADPAKPRKKVNIVLGTIIGFIVGTLLAFLRDSLDGTLQTAEQIATTTRLPLLGKIPAGHGMEIISDYMNNLNGNLAMVESFRRLRVNLISSNIAYGQQTILVTGTESSSDKSKISTNLAIAVAKSGRSVVLVDCNLNMPSLHTILQLPNEKGLSNLLLKQIEPAAAIQPSAIPNLFVVTGGAGLSEPREFPALPKLAPKAVAVRLQQGGELLGTTEMVNFLHYLKETYDVVLLDAPTLTTVTDAAVLAPLADRVLLVVTEKHSRRDAVRAICEQLGRANAKSIGVVIN